MPEDTLIKYGNGLTDLEAVPQPNSTIVFDACGLVQAQVTFAIDYSIISSATARYESGIGYPFDCGVDLSSYKYHISLTKANVAMLTVDYMGIVGGENTKAQIVGVSTTTAQPIETHPNFPDFAGYPDLQSSWVNNATFTKKVNIETNETQFSFNGFGVAKSTDGFAGGVNIKAGIRQYLRPMQNIRGTIIFSGTGESGAMAAGIGKTLSDTGFDLLINNTAVTGALNGTYCLLASANVETIGVPDAPVATKVVYDIMVSGDDPWDADLYEEGF
jgi:hypothetical protein